ncbi:CocE/NonD family hydrolase [Permianibacter sp. IMCC34836]|uniref:CocE/NonD family hydrolase n=1 Tax=Permianibacter fluminis TaxID=2738515 RepID=UPI0015537AC2|nr:CocE/NonD family hydrolase [Permianibacter fluminis]NQD38179.1 CocE/NonD family hydrolase [Permianibacter fluminis]
MTLRSVLPTPALLFSLLALFGSTPLAAAETPDPAVERSNYIRSHYAKFEYRVPVRDGARLFTSVYLPNDASPGKRYPILLVRTPYSVAPYGLDRYKEKLGPTFDYEKDGFIFVFQDVRGRNMSEGDFRNMTPHNPNKKNKQDVDESSDTYDSIDWLLKNLPNHNGRVGQWGISYPGFYTSAGAIDSHPALKAVSPQAPIADWWRGDDMHRNGAFNLQLAFGFFSGFGKARPELTDDENPKKFEYGTPDGYQFLLDLGGLSNVDNKYFKHEIAAWTDFASHPDYDDYWQARNLLPHLKNIKAAVLTVGGWYDTEDLYGPLHTYESIEKQNPGIRNTLIMGPWTHGGWVRTDGDKVGDADFGFKTSLSYQPIELAFFKHYLKDGDDPKLPEAWLFETGANRWRSFDSWPPKTSKEQRWFLQEKNALTTTAPTQDAAFDDYLSDPAKPVPYSQELTTRWSKDYIAADQRFVANRPDVLVYQSEPLAQDTTIAGPIDVELFVATTGTDADYIVKLIDVTPGVPQGWNEDMEKAGKKNRGGQQTLIRGEPMRARYRDSWSAPKPMTPGAITPVRYRLNDVLHTFQRGHRIMVQVHSSWFPFIDRNPQQYLPNIFQAKDSDFVRATQQIYRDRQHPSAITVRLLPAADASR